MGKQWKECQTIFWGSKIIADGECSHEINRCLLHRRGAMANLYSILKSRDYFAKKGLCSQGSCFSIGHVWMWELDYKESWAPKNWCFWSVLDMTLKCPLDCKQIQPVHPKGNQPRVFFGRTDAEAETPNTLAIWCEELIGKDPDAGKNWKREEKGMTEDEMVRWHHCLNRHEFE